MTDGAKKKAKNINKRKVKKILSAATRNNKKIQFVRLKSNLETERTDL